VTNIGGITDKLKRAEIIRGPRERLDAYQEISRFLRDDEHEDAPRRLTDPVCIPLLA